MSGGSPPQQALQSSIVGESESVELEMTPVSESPHLKQFTRNIVKKKTFVFIFLFFKGVEGGETGGKTEGVSLPSNEKNNRF